MANMARIIAERLESIFGWNDSSSSIRAMCGHIIVDDGVYVMAYGVEEIDSFCDRWEGKNPDYSEHFCNEVWPVADKELAEEIADEFGVYIVDGDLRQIVED